MKASVKSKSLQTVQLSRQRLSNCHRCVECATLHINVAIIIILFISSSNPFTYACVQQAHSEHLSKIEDFFITFFISNIFGELPNTTSRQRNILTFINLQLFINLFCCSSNLTAMNLDLNTCCVTQTTNYSVFNRLHR